MKAFTVLEIILVVTIISLISGFGVLFSQTSQVRADINAQRDLVVSYMRLAQSNADSGKGGVAHGIHFDSAAYVLFEGTSYSASDPDNIIQTLPTSVQFQNINLSGGGSDLIFTNPDGNTAQSGTLELYSSNISQTRTITIQANGAIFY